jgi:apocytochrome f|uniref:Cytochrome f n=1 Tax=Pseudopedinella elastica TaxID=35684 RepID=A0A516ZAB1_9STRA|nr:cytochrome f [Pseudopedinella elastica]QDR24647.1 cytochrome f [Pseudopedinella elastica]|tara:strand:- start:2751 stop:3698 length:948 start_codon:yes stop_codon:yes gene_type:complete
MQIFHWKINLKSFAFISLLTTFALFTEPAFAFPIYAQQAYESPREANGRIVCANCHLAQKTTEIETPQAVLPNSVFEAVVKIPYDLSSKQVLASGARGGLNVGAVVLLPEGFKLAPPNQVSKEIKEKNKGVYISPYSSKAENILVVGPIAGDTHQEIIFPVLAPDPETDKTVNYIKYPIYVGANRGRGQVNPTGDKTNNNAVLASTAGLVVEATQKEAGGYEVTIKGADGQLTKQSVPKGLELAISNGKTVAVDQPLAKDPNVGGFGQTETEIVLQSPARIYGYMALCFFITLTQIFLVIKKKQFEKVQAAEMNF